MTVTQKDPALGLDCSLTRRSVFSKAKDVVEVKGPARELLKISFHRTIRVPDNSHDFNLPPSMGLFPLYSVANYTESLPAPMARKGGLFLPMYRRYSLSP